MLILCEKINSTNASKNAPSQKRGLSLSCERDMVSFHHYWITPGSGVPLRYVLSNCDVK